MRSVPRWRYDRLTKYKNKQVGAIAVLPKDSCFEPLEGYLTIPFKQVLKNLRLFRAQNVNSTFVYIV